MIAIKQFLFSSIGKKTVMALTGLFLCLFLIEHLYGNILLYSSDGGAAFNEYSHTMSTSLLIRIVEIVLFVCIILHVLQALVITVDNNKARPVKYAVPTSAKGSSWFSRNMGFTGSLVLFFIVVHIYNFFIPYRIVGLENNETIAMEVKEAFQNIYYVIIYIVGVSFLFFHLLHAFRSAFHTLGLNNKKYTPIWITTGTIFAWVMWLGFISFPILFYFGLAGGSINLN